MRKHYACHCYTHYFLKIITKHSESFKFLVYHAFILLLKDEHATQNKNIYELLLMYIEWGPRHQFSNWTPQFAAPALLWAVRVTTNIINAICYMAEQVSQSKTRLGKSRHSKAAECTYHQDSWRIVNNCKHFCTSPSCSLKKLWNLKRLCMFTAYLITHFVRTHQPKLSPKMAAYCV